MPTPRKVMLPKSCERCGRQFQRKMIGSRLEDSTAFTRRKFCSLPCANSRGASTRQGHLARARKLRGLFCEACNWTENLHAHHVNGDITENTPANIQTLCVHCHILFHNMLARLGRPISGRMPKLYPF